MSNVHIRASINYISVGTHDVINDQCLNLNSGLFESPLKSAEQWVFLNLYYVDTIAYPFSEPDAAWTNPV